MSWCKPVDIVFFRALLPRSGGLSSLFPGHILDGVYDGFHTSGHADVETLEEACRILRPRLGIIPIHKEALSTYKALDIAKEFPVIESSEQIEDVTVSIL